MGGLAPASPTASHTALQKTSVEMKSLPAEAPAPAPGLALTFPAAESRLPEDP